MCRLTSILAQPHFFFLSLATKAISICFSQKILRSEKTPLLKGFSFK